MFFNKGSDNINTSNIFEEFENDEDLKKEVDSMKKSENQDVFFYISKVGVVFQNLVILLIFVLGTAYGYIYIQKNALLSNNQIIDPLCGIILGDIPYPNTNYCSSIAYTKKTYEQELKTLKEQQSKKILSLMSDLYTIENFNKSKEVIFLLTRSNDRLKPLEIMEKFDSMKNEYEPIEKQKIQCFDITIDDDNTLSARCEAYSAGFERDIKGYDGGSSNVMGTSISIANSFINFIEKKSKDFTVIEKDKVFKSEQILGSTNGFTHKTVFKLKLKYNFNSLSL